jgi:hypothetical protein
VCVGAAEGVVTDGMYVLVVCWCVRVCVPVFRQQRAA